MHVRITRLRRDVQKCSWCKEPIKSGEAIIAAQMWIKRRNGKKWLIKFWWIIE